MKLYLKSITNQSSYLLYITISLFLILTNCATLAHRPYACAEISNPHAKLGGFLFMIGDCAPFSYFYLEIGDFYRMRKDSLDFEVKLYKRKNNIVSTSLERFAKTYNCPEEAYDEFADLLKFHQEEIFGPNFENGPRRVSLNIIKGIERNPYLSFYCTGSNIRRQIKKYGL